MPFITHTHGGNVYKVATRLHPAESIQGSLPTTCFQEAVKQGPDHSRIVTARLGVKGHDKFSYSVNLANFVRVMDYILKGIEVHFYIGGDQKSTTSYTASEIAHLNYFLISPLWPFEQTTGRVSVEIVAHYKERGHEKWDPISFRYDFKYSKDEGNPLTFFIPRCVDDLLLTPRPLYDESVTETRKGGNYFARCELEELERKGWTREHSAFRTASRQQEPKSPLVSSNEKSPSDVDRERRAARRLAAPKEMDIDTRSPRPDREQDSPLSVRSMAAPAHNSLSARRSGTPLPPVMAISPCVVAKQQHGRAFTHESNDILSTGSQSIISDSSTTLTSLRQAPDIDQVQHALVSRTQSIENSRAVHLTSEELKHKEACDEAEARATFHRRQREMVAAERRVLREELWAAEEMAKLAKVKEELKSLKRKADEAEE